MNWHFGEPSNKFSRKLTIIWSIDCIQTGLLSINKWILYPKKIDWMQDGTSELDAK